MHSAENISELSRHPGFGSHDDGNEKDAQDAVNKAKALIKEALEIRPGHWDDEFSGNKMDEARSSRADQFARHQQDWTPNHGLPGVLGKGACSSEQGLDHSEHRKTRESNR